MTMRLDIVSNDAGELVRLEHARDLGSTTVQAVYRLLKLVQIHDMSNQAFVRQLEQTHEALVEYGLRSGAHFNVLFASKAVFVGGQLLKGSRAAYEAATELGDILEWCGGSDLTVQKDVAQREVQLFAEAVGAALRGAKGGARTRRRARRSACVRSPTPRAFAASRWSSSPSSRRSCGRTRPRSSSCGGSSPTWRRAATSSRAASSASRRASSTSPTARPPRSSASPTSGTRTSTTPAAP